MVQVRHFYQLKQAFALVFTVGKCLSNLSLVKCATGSGSIGMVMMTNLDPFSDRPQSIKCIDLALQNPMCFVFLRVVEKEAG